MLIADINSIEALSVWDNINRKFYSSPYHDISIAEGLLLARNKIIVCHKETDHNFIFCVFEITPDHAKCVFTGAPFITDYSLLSYYSLVEFLEDITSRLNIPLYFPLVYADIIDESILTRMQAMYWLRLPSPIINYLQKDETLVNRALQRIGNRALRRIKAFEKLNCRIETICDTNVKAILTKIESSSWKASFQQDLIFRNQIELYSALANSTDSHIRVAFFKEEPIAYRFDYVLNSNVYCLKWSFSELFRKASPGFYMLVKDLDSYWKNNSVQIIDLHGSPDLLKDCIAEKTARRRIDFGWPPDNSRIAELKQERLNHDNSILTNYVNGRSIKHLYG